MPERDPKEQGRFEQDSQEQEQVVEQVRQSEERFRLLVNSVSDYAIFMLDPEGRVLSWNPGAERFKGYKADEIIGQSYTKFYTEEDRLAQLPQRLLRKARDEGHVEVEGWRVRKDGTRFWASVVITSLVDETGEFLGYSKVTRDLTERKLAEDQRRQFELFVKSVTDYAILMLDPEGRIVGWNRGAENLKGYQEHEILGQFNRVFYTPEDIADGRPERLLAIAAKEGHVEDEGWRVRKDGTHFWANVVLTAVHDETGALVGFAKITRDMTHKKEMQDLAAKTAHLQAANRLKSEFLTTMSHELRTPLNSIIGFTELVLMTQGERIDELATGNLNTVLRNARHLLTLISEILDLSKIEAGQSAVHAGPIDPNQLALAAVNSTRALADQKGITLEFEPAPELDMVISDETKVRQIVINLLSNAIKFTDQGGVKVELSTSGTDTWRISVIDTGLGIAPEHQDLVFQAFRQVDSTTTRAKGGTGLGLAISRKLTEMLEGSLTLQSAPGQGSTFTVELPRQLQGAVSSAPAHRPDLPQPQDLAAPPDGVPLVLAIDDDPESLQLVVENLKGSPYRVVTATSAESGLMLARELKPAAITLDVLMPQIDGWMALRRLKSHAATADIPVILLSFLENKGLAHRLGASDYLSKPIDGRALIEALDRVTGAAVGKVS